MSVEGRELFSRGGPVGSIKYFKICKRYEVETSWLLVDTDHHTCAKFTVLSPILSQISQKTRGQWPIFADFWKYFKQKL